MSNTYFRQPSPRYRPDLKNEADFLVRNYNVKITDLKEHDYALMEPVGGLSTSRTAFDEYMHEYRVRRSAMYSLDIREEDLVRLSRSCQELTEIYNLADRNKTVAAALDQLMTTVAMVRSHYVKF
jgi:hypothetical protein